MSENCIRFTLKNIYYDTVDQPVIPIDIVNECTEDATINIEIKTIDGKHLHSEKTRLKPSGKKLIEIALPYYGDIMLTATGKLEKSSITMKLVEQKLKL